MNEGGVMEPLGDTMVTIEYTEFAGWDECVRVSNGIIELIVPTEIGPRVLSLGFVDGENVLYVHEENAGTVGGDGFKIYGGHRLWHAPEADPRTYQPENQAIDVTEHDSGITLVRGANVKTGIAKEIDFSLAEDEAALTVTHYLHNEGLWPVELAPWGITQLGAGSRGVLPIAEREEGFLPDRSMAIWPYVDVSDDRIVRTDDAIWIDHDDGDDVDGKIKLGASGDDEWIGGVAGDVLFRKSFSYDADAEYPDMGCAIEIYTDPRFLEIETLGPLSTVDPGDSVEHQVEWTLADGVETNDRAELLEAFTTEL